MCIFNSIGNVNRKLIQKHIIEIIAILLELIFIIECLILFTKIKIIATIANSIKRHNMI